MRKYYGFLAKVEKGLLKETIANVTFNGPVLRQNAQKLVDDLFPGYFVGASYARTAKKGGLTDRDFEHFSDLTTFNQYMKKIVPKAERKG